MSGPAVLDPKGFLAVIDPATEKIWRFTADDNLPPMDEFCVTALCARQGLRRRLLRPHLVRHRHV